MTIPPIGPTPPQPVPQEERPNNNNGKQVKNENRPDAARKADVENSDRMNISRDVEIVRTRQAEISRLQVAERAASKMQAIAKELGDDSRELRDARNAQDSKREDEIKQRISRRVEELKSQAREATFDNKSVLTGERFKTLIEGKTESVKFPDAFKEIKDVERSVNEPVTPRGEVREDRFAENMRKFEANAREIRKKLENDVRNHVANATRESSKSRPKDVQDAERLINEARKNVRPESNQPRDDKASKIASRAVNLLQ